jgi:1-deoxy-D-xylulose-5-phosphate synthase
MSILAPANGQELTDMLRFALFHKAPTAIRYPKSSVPNILSDRREPIKYGKSDIIHKGKEFAILAVGSMMEQAHHVFEHLRTLGHDPSLINARFVKPMDMDMIESLTTYEHVFVLEEHVLCGGYGSNLLSEVNAKHIDIKNIHCFTLPNMYIEQGSRKEIMEQYNLDSESIINRILKIL